jgi:hypothetical protein
MSDIESSLSNSQRFNLLKNAVQLWNVKINLRVSTSLSPDSAPNPLHSHTPLL